MYIGQQLAHDYPEITDKLTHPIVPGVTPCHLRASKIIPHDAGVIGFIGKEWKRKGLHQVADILGEIVKKRPNIRLRLAGMEASDVQGLFHGLNMDIQYLGRVNPASFYQQLDVLLHPAIQEPYGMVITEALSAAVPVVVSDVCGAACEVNDACGAIVGLNAPIQAWMDAIETQLTRKEAIQPYQRSWKDVALEHIQVYQTIKQDDA